MKLNISMCQWHRGLSWEVLGGGEGVWGQGWPLLGPTAGKVTHLDPRGPLVSSVSFRSNGASITLQRDGHAPLDPLSVPNQPS